MKGKFHGVLIVFIALAVLVSCDIVETPSQTADDLNSRILKNGGLLYDTDGNRINAHGGGMLKIGDNYYWYGEHRYDDGNFIGVSCYRSSDLVHWKNLGDALRADSDPALNSCMIERPKVIYNKVTKKYVMWMHKEGAFYNYGPSQAAVAYADKPEGPFTYLKSFRPFDDRPDLDLRDGGTQESDDPLRSDPDYPNFPLGYMSRDSTLFVDTDGTAYFASACYENVKLNIYRLTSDYLSIDTNYLPIRPFTGPKKIGSADNPAWQRESPCLFKRGDFYFLITSKATGWFPNQNLFAYAKNINGPWSAQANFSTSDPNNSTYLSQSSFVMEVSGSEGSTYLYMGDRWAPAWSGPLSDSGYVFAPLNFDGAGTTITMKYGDALVMDAAKGKISYPQYYNLSAVQSGYPNAWTFDRNSATTLNLDLSSGNTNIASSRSGVPVTVATQSTTKLTQQWRFEKTGDYYRIINRWSGKALDAGAASQNGDTLTVTDWQPSLNSQQWEMNDTQIGGYQLKSQSAGLFLDGNRRDKLAEFCEDGFYPEIPYTWDDTGKSKVVTDAKQGQNWIFTAISE